MATHIIVTCDGCHCGISSTKGFHLESNAWIGAMSFKLGDFCISCLAKMCGAEIITPAQKEKLKALERAQADIMDLERRENKDW